MDHIYMELAGTIEERINSNHYISGSKLPSERQLAAEFKVSRMTARHAVDILQKKGLVYKEQGRGTFIKAPSFEQKNVKSFTETIEGLGYKVTTKVLELSTIFSSEFLAKQLEVDETTEFLKIKRLRLGNNIPMALETIYIPKNYAKDLEQEALSASIYHLLEKKYGYVVDHVSYKMEATMTNPVFEKLMELDKRTALLKVSGCTVLVDGFKLFYEESYYRSDLYSYQVDIHRKF